MGSLQAVLRESSQEVETFGHSDRMRSAMGPWKTLRWVKETQVRHMWTAPIGKLFFDVTNDLVSFSHMSGLLVRHDGRWP